eukprot:190635-Pyramimonas_sp.AAC.1
MKGTSVCSRSKHQSLKSVCCEGCAPRTLKEACSQVTQYNPSMAANALNGNDKRPIGRRKR